LTEVVHKYFATILILVALLATGLILVSTARGPGVGGDATVYISAARSLNNGQGLGMPGPDGEFQPLSYYPPLFSLSLSALGIFGVDLAAGARWLNALLFGLLVWLTGYTLWRASRSPLTGLLAALVLAVSPVAIPPFSWAMSEPLANFLGFFSLACMLWYLEKSARRSLLFLSAVVGGLSIITRYASLPFVAAGVVGILALASGNLKRRLGESGLYLVLGLIPAVIWEIWDYAHSASLASRSLEQGGPGLISMLVSFWQSLRLVFLGWLFPDSWLTSFLQSGLLQTLLSVAAITAVVGWAVIIFRRKVRLSEPGLFNLAALVGIFFGIYTGFILATYLFVSPTVDVSQRIMLPLHVALIWGAAGLAVLTQRTASSALRYRLGVVVLVAGLAVSGWYASRSVRIVQQNYRDGLGYYSTAWQTSATIQQVRQLPTGTLLVSNEVTAIYFLTGRLAYNFAESRQSSPVADFYRYGDGSLANDPAQQVFRQKGAALVLFSNFYSDMVALYGPRTQERIDALVKGLKTAYSGSDGRIYYYPGSGQ
jgi:hypothetical protein